MSTPRTAPARLVGWVAVVWSAMYFLSDLIEVAQGGFSSGQLLLTLLTEVAVGLAGVAGLIAAGVRDLAIAGMGVAVTLRRELSTGESPASRHR